MKGRENAVKFNDLGGRLTKTLHKLDLIAVRKAIRRVIIQVRIETSLNILLDNISTTILTQGAYRDPKFELVN